MKIPKKIILKIKYIRPIEVLIFSFILAILFTFTGIWQLSFIPGIVCGYLYHKRSINLREVVLEQLNLTFPFRPLCSENCQGICPVCGKLIAEGMCSCVNTQPDPRFGKLKSLYKDKE